MAVELNRATFTRLVWLHVATGFALIVAIAPQYLIGRWSQFGELFDALVEQQFGADETPVPIVIVVLIAFVMALGWMIVSIVGLLRFRHWARFGFWASIGVMLGLYVAVFGFRPVFASPFDDLLATLDSALFGAILLLAYAKGYGSEWFNEPSAPIEE